MPQESASTLQDHGEYLRTLSDAFATHYSDRSDEWTCDLSMRAFPLLVQGEVKLSETEAVCDLGCGAGIDCEVYARIAGHVVGIDIHRHDNWNAAMRRHRNLTFRCCDVVEFRADSPFELVVDNGSFHHQHPGRYSTYLDRVRQLMREGGWLALSTFKNAKKSEITDQNGRIHKYFSDRELRELLNAAGLKVYKEMDCYRPEQRDYYRFSLIRHA